MTIAPRALPELVEDLLTYLLENPEIASEFFLGSGFPPAALREAVGDSDFQICLVDFLLQDDRRVLAFAERFGRKPDDLMAAQTLLSGPGSHGWVAD